MSPIDNSQSGFNGLAGGHFAVFDAFGVKLPDHEARNQHKAEPKGTIDSKRSLLSMEIRRRSSIIFASL